jgi:NAD(P)-dependent dehydrogenase (short-subunit alcohol dehydrogenase family)
MQGALHFAARGASLLLFDIAEGPLKETAKLVKEAGADAYFGQPVHVVVCDVTDHAAVDAAVQEGCSGLGGPIHLCWNNGPWPPCLDHAFLPADAPEYYARPPSQHEGRTHALSA